MLFIWLGENDQFMDLLLVFVVFLVLPLVFVYCCVRILFGILDYLKS